LDDDPGVPVPHEPGAHRQPARWELLHDRPRGVDPDLRTAAGHPQRRRDQIRATIDAVATQWIRAVRIWGRCGTRDPGGHPHCQLRQPGLLTFQQLQRHRRRLLIQAVDVEQRQATERDKPRLEVQQIPQRPHQSSIRQQRRGQRTGIDINVEIDIGSRDQHATKLSTTTDTFYTHVRSSKSVHETSACAQDECSDATACANSVRHEIK